MYTSTVQYPDNPIAKSLRDVARVQRRGWARAFSTPSTVAMTRTPARWPRTHACWASSPGPCRLLCRTCEEHNAADEVVILVFTEFGRRIKDNGSGTDHGSGGGAFIIGERVKGGLYAEYPSLDPSEQLYGEDLQHHVRLPWRLRHPAGAVVRP